ncbi:MAG: hypothetical protein HN509_08675 [Halobacteriovoraceae bacterium]|nr:hypothetical protein [Halobacteriovoraceae bacterium]MBT5093453.1 hypothetical protein [Halobacteriovoraceae bacterium]
MKFLPFLISIFLVFSSCTKKKTPEEMLTDFVNYRFSSNQDRQTILEKTTGGLNVKIASMSDDEFAAFVDLKGFRKKKLKINLKKCTEKQCFITYTLGYDQKIRENEKKEPFSVEIKKIAELHLDSGIWKVNDVNNVKTYYNSQENIDVFCDGNSDECKN